MINKYISLLTIAGEETCSQLLLSDSAIESPKRFHLKVDCFRMPYLHHGQHANIMLRGSLSFGSAQKSALNNIIFTMGETKESPTY